MALPAQPVSPKAAPLPPVPKVDPLTAAQWRTLLAIADTIIPDIRPASIADFQTHYVVSDNDHSTALTTLKGRFSGTTDALAKEYLQESASSDSQFRDAWHRLFGLLMPQQAKRELTVVLNLLDTRAGALLLTGYMTPFSAQPFHVRESILHSWQTARIPAIRGLYRSLTMLTKQTWTRTSPTLRKVIGVPRTPMNMIPGKGFDYAFLQFPAGEVPETIETDVVIIGSGCGGGVCAKNLAEAGHKVIVVDNGYHWTPDHFPMEESVGWNNLFMNQSFIASDDSSMSVLCGETWGGGGTVNWSASLQTQGYVRREWAAAGLPFFTSAEYQESLDRVCDRMGVSTDYIKHNVTNLKLLEGARRLGYTHKVVPQNTGGKQHWCGYCNFGCGSCEKQGPVVSFLPDAARAGATFIEGFHAEKIIFSHKKGTKVATGVLGTWTSRDANGGIIGDRLVRRKVIIKAKRVIVSGGTMQSPLLLLRSGLSNYHIGRNLYLHPVSVLGAIHPDDVEPWDGPILTAVVSEYENLDGKGHGVKLEAVNMAPSTGLLFVPWRNGLDYKLECSRMRNMAGYISMARDRDTGRVYPDPVDGRVRVQYTASKFDRRHITEGLIALAKTQYAAGATEIYTTIPNLPSFVRSADSPAEGINDAKFQAWLEQIRSSQLPPADNIFASAHQMGTCRMSATPKAGVVDPKGQVWGTQGLFVADASVFPSASGVNPMVTNMAISDYISRGIAKGLEERPRL
ncbi:long chain fatty alcohol oxidase [Sporormia fimetaria CBS 119925]|uniref:Long-chain-alcohol oxidase n=1 Tax=Sporormia fimetaria CBS 119925 TaxID=1340428 RepID=A0A6A6V0P5_9PLEO|nr:long chain fatty alcohol oxidase [Sporormia fimetaria CBS 119925]